MTLTALIAEDEPLLARALQTELARAWPELRVVALAQDGDEAVSLALQHQPTVLWLDIRMPGRDGLEAAQAIIEEWPSDRPLPLIVFVTAYDHYALQAFERAAADYLLKPVQPERLKACCERLQARLNPPAPAPSSAVAEPHEDAHLLARLRALLSTSAAPSASPERLQVLQVSQGANISLVPVDEVIYFEAADKYVRVLTADKEHLIRLSLRELMGQLDPQQFWQIHRGTVVQWREVAQALRDETGKVTLTLRQRPERLAVSRIYASRFKAL
ncbi:LytR/AlgR family response regulator transcription factor [Ideonella paludis]|uniref:Response regulator transcription factor n=1 Tax=Ideonella paludis TaxID=1233411 RepID=A0ABS5DX78_9BURK|nr:LytTR family DNA-binding domain-containing protein [Ideonella paludis]MBQ0935684.1 response regulator transcription factor [Ideonella paludis]